MIVQMDFTMPPSELYGEFSVKDRERASGQALVYVPVIDSLDITEPKVRIVTQPKRAVDSIGRDEALEDGGGKLEDTSVYRAGEDVAGVAAVPCQEVSRGYFQMDVFKWHGVGCCSGTRRLARVNSPKFPIGRFGGYLTEFLPAGRGS